MNKFCDLHTHSVFSDGTCTPSQLIEEAAALGLSAIALTDHNTVDGLWDFLAAAEGTDVLAVPGVEFSVDYGDTELHLLGLFIDPVHFPTVQAVANEYLRQKAQSNLDLIAALEQAGYVVDFEKIQAMSPNGNINRAHIAAALTEKGYTASITEAILTLLAKDGPYYRQPARPTVWEMLDLLNTIGAVPVLAHPFLNLNEDQLRVFLPAAKERGLRGMEAAYSTYDEATTACAERLAREFGLLPSGGSDYHGANKVGIYMGTGRGNLKVPAEWVDKLKKI
ncbi:MAG: PHP domain-containing protein [Oscillospiraceae bacterium]|nr:PHP domain-containing protein [Oscillospiraceae bacterium]